MPILGSLISSVLPYLIVALVAALAFFGFKWKTKREGVLQERAKWEKEVEEKQAEVQAKVDVARQENVKVKAESNKAEELIKHEAVEKRAENKPADSFNPGDRFKF